jgi:hypothetical protein
MEVLMFFRKQVVLALIILITPGLSWAADYKDWLPHIPDKLGGLKATSEGDGMNMSSGGSAMSTLNKTYGSGNKEINISISYLHDSKRQTQALEPVEQMSMEMGGMVMKTIKIQGFDAVYQYIKAEKNSLITVNLKADATFILASSGIGAKGEKYYIGLFENINLKKIYASF